MFVVPNKWKVETDHWPVTTKQAHIHTKTLASVFSTVTKGQSDVNRRLVKCVVSYSHTSYKQKISTLRIQRDSVPVQIHLLRSKQPWSSSHCVHGTQRDIRLHQYIDDWLCVWHAVKKTFFSWHSQFLLQDYLHAWKWLQLLFHLASLEKLVKNGRRILRHLQFQLKENWRHPQTKNRLICSVD